MTPVVFRACAAAVFSCLALAMSPGDVRAQTGNAPSGADPSTARPKSATKAANPAGTPSAGRATAADAPRRPAPKPGASSATARSRAEAEAQAAADRARVERERGEIEAAAAAKLAAERAEVERLRGTTVNLIRLMVEQGVLDKDQALALLPEAERAQLADVVPIKKRTRDTRAVPSGDAAEDVATADGRVAAEEAAAEPDPATATGARAARRKKAQTVRVPYVPETVKNEIRDQIRQDVLAQAKAERWGEPGALPEWLDRIAIDGDLRVRHQFESYPAGNPDPLTYNAITNSNIENTQFDRQSLRLRARIGLLARINDHWGAAFRIATGNGVSPVSANTLVGDDFRQRPLFLDRGYIKWDPSERWSAVAGRFPNPFFWPTELVWDEDLNFDGVAGSFKPQINASTSAFVSAGWLLMDHQTSTPVTPNPRDKTIAALQAGADWRPDSQLHARIGAALYDFRNLAGLRNSLNSQANDWSAVGFRQKGNSTFDINAGLPGAPVLLGRAADFRLINLNAEVDLAHLAPLVFKLQGDYVKNIGYDEDAIRARTGLGIRPETTGYVLRLIGGREAIRDLHDWQLFVGYRHVERDAVVDSFTDSNFFLGGSNTKGPFIGGLYGFDRNVFLRVRWLSGNTISGPPLAIDVLQSDFSVRF